MPAIRIPRPLAAIAFAAAVACNADPVVLCACSYPVPYTLLYGEVKDPSGQGVQGATVHLETGPPSCQSVASTFSAPTDGGGRYRAAAHAVGAETQQCVRLWALAPPGSGLRNSDTVTLTIPTPSSAPADSLRRDIALRAP